MSLVESEEDLLAWVMAAAYVGLPDIDYRVYQNMLRRYRVLYVLKSLVRHLEPFF